MLFANTYNFFESAGIAAKSNEDNSTGLVGYMLLNRLRIKAKCIIDISKNSL